MTLVCPVCHSEDIGGVWEQDLRVPVWLCRACKFRWPVRAGDGVASAVKAADKAAIDGIVEMCRVAKWSEHGPSSDQIAEDHRQ